MRIVDPRLDPDAGYPETHRTERQRADKRRSGGRQLTGINSIAWSEQLHCKAHPDLIAERNAEIERLAAYYEQVGAWPTHPNKLNRLGAKADVNDSL